MEKSMAIGVSTVIVLKDKIWFDAYNEFVLDYRPATKEEVLNLYYEEK